MFIEDEELRNLFKIASEEHLQNLEDGVLHLEKYLNDYSGLEELLREAHSLKGDSRMLGVKDVETLTHQVEHILGCIKRSEIQPTIEMCDRLCQGIDAIRKLVQESTTGEPSGVNTFQALAHLMGANTEPQNQVVEKSQPTEATRISNQDSDPTALTSVEITYSAATGAFYPTENYSNQEELFCDITPEVPAPLEEIASILALADADIEPTPTNLQNQIPEILETRPLTPSLNQEPLPLSPQKIPAPSTYRIDTIRVETRYLDALMTQTGELTVTKIRIAHRLSEIEEIVNLWDEWSRDAFGGDRLWDNRNFTDERQNLSNYGSNINLRDRAEERFQHLGNLVNHLRNAVYEDNARLDIISSDLDEGIRTLRLLPLSTIFQLFTRMVRDLAKTQGKEVDLIIEGGDTRADKRILEEMKDPLMHILRNCVDHGIETALERQQAGKPSMARIQLKASQTATNIIIEVTDDGRGLEIDKIKQTALKRGIYRQEELATMTESQIHSLIFAPGFSTRTFVTEVSGRGVGLDVVRTNVERLKGAIFVESTPKMGTTFRIHLGTTLATVHVLILDVGGRAYALPVEFVQTTRLVSQDEIFAIEGRETIIVDTQPLSVVQLTNLLELPTQPRDSTKHTKQVPCIIVKVGQDTLGLFVDALLEEQEVILKPQSKLLKRVRNVAGATILGTGEVCMVLNPSDLIQSVRRRGTHLPASSLTVPTKLVDATVKGKQVILLAEDSIAIRTQEKRILEGAGYEVVTAVDGLDAYNKLRTRSFDVVISDVQMPNLDGLGLASSIRQHKEYNELPIILVTSLASDEDKRRGAEAGANAYITKGTFSQEILLETLKRLV